MSFEPSSEPIVRLAWERWLGLPARSLVNADGTSRIVVDTRERQSGDAATLTFVRLWNLSVLAGPGPLLDRAAGCGDEQLGDRTGLLQLTRDFGGRCEGVHTLYYADDLAVRQPAAEVLVSRAEPESAALAALCPPDDVDDVALGARPHQFTVMADGGPVASSAYAEWAGLLADLGTLVSPGHRRRGLATLATSIAAHEALASGLIIQGRADAANAPAHALAASVGLIAGGLQATASLHARRR